MAASIQVGSLCRSAGHSAISTGLLLLQCPPCMLYVSILCHGIVLYNEVYFACIQAGTGTQDTVSCDTPAQCVCGPDFGIKPVLNRY